MRELLAGDGGSVLVSAATTPAAALACEGLAHATTAPNGTPIHPADQLPNAQELQLQGVRIAPCEPATRAHIEAWAAASGLPITREPAARHHASNGVAVIAISSTTTGSGKTALTRRIARTLQRSGKQVAVARHPIANLLLWDRFQASIVRDPRTLTDRPVEEREELAPVVGAGIPVVTGLDPEGIVSMACAEAGDGGVVVWDGGGASEPWIDADMHIVVVDLLRPPPDGTAERLAAAHAVVLTKGDSATPERAREIEAFVREHNADATLILSDMAVAVSAGQQLTNRDVVCVEDANSLVLGGLSAGAAAVAARRFRCGVVDPRPFAVGAIATTLRDFPHIGGVIPALGRTPAEIDDLASSVYATPGDAVLWASNADPSAIVPDEQRPVIRAYGELTEVAGASLQDLVSPFLPGAE